MSRKYLILLSIPLVFAMILGCSFGGFIGKPTSTPTPTKTFVPTFTATPSIVLSPTETPGLAETPTPTLPAETPTPTQPPTPTLGPPTNTPTPRPPAPTPTPRPPRPTNTPQPVYEYQIVRGPTADRCDPGYCLPEISGIVLDAEGDPLHFYTPVWLKLESDTFGVQWCRTEDRAQSLQPGQFKFQSDGLFFGGYSLTVYDMQGGRALSPPLIEHASTPRGGQQTGIIFQKIH